MNNEQRTIELDDNYSDVEFLNLSNQNLERQRVYWILINMNPYDSGAARISLQGRAPQKKIYCEKRKKYAILFMVSM